MASEVKWIKMMVGMFDGMSFKKIKKAKIGGESFRDKLTAVWFELLDFAGRCNHDGAFISPREIPFTDLSDIAIMIDRDEEELRLCMTFFVNEGMITVIDDVYSLTNWAEYQNKEGLDKIREQNRLRQAKYKQNQKMLKGNGSGNVTVTLGNAIDKEEEKEKERDLEGDGEESASTTSKLEKMGGTLGQGVLMLSEEQEDDLLDRLSFDEFNLYTKKLSDYIIAHPEKTFKSHYQTILKWVKEDRARV